MYADIEIDGERQTVHVVMEKEYGHVVESGGVTFTVDRDNLYNVREEK